jgi:hypothetical protein
MKLTLPGNSLSNRQFVLLAPIETRLPEVFRITEIDSECHSKMLDEVQRFRGRVYLAEGAISKSNLTPDGRHWQAIDSMCWHLLLLGPDERVMGCLRYHLHYGPTSFEDLSVRTAAIAKSEEWSESFRRAVVAELDIAQASRFSFAEVGGWALDEDLRGNSDALRTILCTYAWSNLVGGCLGLCTATSRNSSASILRRIGGRPFEWKGAQLPAYYDPSYGCNMEVLRFDCRFPSPKFRSAIRELSLQLSYVPVICRSQARTINPPSRCPLIPNITESGYSNRA